MAVTVRFTPDRDAINDWLRGSGSPVVREVTRVTEEVADAVRAEAPRRTGRLKSSIRTEVRPSAATVQGWVYTDLEYGPYVQTGTGIYGPRGRPITPRRARFLVFEGRDGRLVFARQVLGQEAQPYLTRGLRRGVRSPWQVETYERYT
jgi:hypothetical protein